MQWRPKIAYSVRMFHRHIVAFPMKTAPIYPISVKIAHCYREIVRVGKAAVVSIRFHPYSNQQSIHTRLYPGKTQFIHSLVFFFHFDCIVLMRLHDESLCIRIYSPLVLYSLGILCRKRLDVGSCLDSMICVVEFHELLLRHMANWNENIAKK